MWFETTSGQSRPSYRPFGANTRSFVCGLQPRAIQGMCNFDFSCGSQAPLVAAMIYPLGGHQHRWCSTKLLLCSLVPVTPASLPASLSTNQGKLCGGGSIPVQMKSRSVWDRPQNQERQQPRSACRTCEGVRAKALPQPLTPRLRTCGRKGDVDGCIAVSFIDMLHDSGAFSREEADEYIKIGTLNGLFVLGRSIGFIGHHLDQKRLRAPLYRHPADDIFINMADVSQPRVLGRI